MRNQGAQWAQRGYHSCKPASLRTTGYLLLSSSVSQNVDLKQMCFQIFLQQKWVSLGLAENCNLGICDYGKPLASPQHRWIREFLHTGDKDVGGGGDCHKTVSMAFHWLNPSQERREDLPLLSGSPIYTGLRELHLLASQLYSIMVSVY